MPTIMPRAFTVFCDEEEDAGQIASTSNSVLGAANPQRSTDARAGLEKENMDPVTGLPTVAPVRPGKKRKPSCSDVLGTKSYRSPVKRTTSSGFIDSALGKSSKISKRPALAQTTNKQKSVADVRPRIPRHLVDSLVYDLTVSPLADVSSAFISGPKGKDESSVQSVSEPISGQTSRTSPSNADEMEIDCLSIPLPPSPPSSLPPTPSKQSTLVCEIPNTVPSCDFTFTLDKLPDATHS